LITFDIHYGTVFLIKKNDKIGKNLCQARSLMIYVM
jgi:hypothetical protein